MDYIYIDEVGNTEGVINVEPLMNQIPQANTTVSFHLSFLTFFNS